MWTSTGVREHQAAFQKIADANGGIRTSGTPGYDVSADYVVERMEAAGYEVTTQEFDFQTFINLGPAGVGTRWRRLPAAPSSTTSCPTRVAEMCPPPR